MPWSVLVVDDSATTRAVVRKSLALARLPVSMLIEARDGREALARLEEQPVDLVLTDLNMPEMPGDELLLALRTHPTVRMPRVLIISTEGSRTRLEPLLEPGQVAMLRKPFTPEQFKAAIESLLEEPCTI